MNILDWFSGEKKEKSIVIDSASKVPAEIVVQFIGGHPVVYYKSNTNTYLRKGFEGNHMIFTIADWCARKMTCIPPILYNVKDKSAAKDYKYLRKEGSFDSYLAARKIKEQAFKEVKDHQILDVLANPNPLMSWDEFIYGYFIFKKFVGNSIIQGIATENGLNAGKVQELWLLPSNYITPVGGQGLDAIDHYTDSRHPDLKIPTDYLIVTRNFSADYRTPGAQLSGMSVLQAATGQLTKSNTSLEAETEALQNRGARNLIFPKIPKELMGGLTLPSGETVDTMNQDLRKRLKEAGNQGTIVNSIELGHIQIGMSPVDLQILETNKADIQLWCSLFHVDSRAVYNDHQSSTKDNMQTARLNSIVDGVFPDLEALKNGLNQKFIKTWGDEFYLDFDYTVLAEIQAQLRETAEKMASTGVFTTNEIREIWKYEKYNGMNGDKILVASTKRILDDLDNVLDDAPIE